MKPTCCWPKCESPAASRGLCRRDLDRVRTLALYKQIPKLPAEIKAWIVHVVYPKWVLREQMRMQKSAAKGLK